MNGTIFDVKEMAVHDGPGIRTTVFFKGCHMRCAWCHNPEGLRFEPQLMYKASACTDCNQCRLPCDHPECRQFGRCVHICPENCLEIVGRSVDSHALAAELKASAAVLGDAFGGFTFSGGEPLAQPQFLLALADELRGYHLCAETSGFAQPQIFKSVIDRLDFVIMDIKLADGRAHEKYTGVGNAWILENFRYLQASRKPFIVRTPLVSQVTDTQENLEQIQKIIGDSLWEKLPFNGAAKAKYKMLGMDDRPQK